MAARHRVYVASSWRNEQQKDIVYALRQHGHEVYDFKNPHGEKGFRWSDITEEAPPWTAHRIKTRLLSAQRAAQGYMSDFRAMEWADTCVLVLPCGRSAHLELGYMAGRGKRTIILLEDGEPDLMWLMANHMCLNIEEIINVLEV